jgi:hypothetical protein
MKGFLFHVFRSLGTRLRNRFIDPSAPFRSRFIDPPAPFRDPPLGVRQPREPGRGGRNSAVALAEPDDNRGVVEAIGHHR